MKSDQEHAKNEIKRLISLYDDLVRTGQYNNFNEDETCRKLILPLFKALGWDIDAKNIADEVTGQHIAGGQKRVDYSFNINSQPVFFLEAKQLSADLYNSEFAKQVINYGYSKTVKWVVLCDFEGIKVFNSLVKTRRLNEKTIIDLKHTEYLEKFDILWLLSKESIVDGKLNEYAKTIGHVDNKIPINELLLSRLLEWRDDLIKQIAIDNPKLSKNEVSECVQKLINRLIFIRTCEDRKIDEPFLLNNLRNESREGNIKRLYVAVVDVFKRFNREYDSSLFEEHEVEKIKVRDLKLDDVIGGLYEDLKENVSFDFSIIDSDMLGSIYEQYLGTIQKEEGAKDKAKRKSHGIYYTPKYIVDYIVKNTLGKILEEALKNKEYSKIGKLKVLDPACGSGSFLLKTLELFDDAYGRTPEFAKLPKGRKIKTLCNNIYGVDLDLEAVELTKLNLLLSSTYSKKRLPNLSHNIECGNSLIDDPKVAGDKAFDWNKRFKDVMDKGGFDVIIGNPPYINVENLSETDRKYLMSTYDTAIKRFDIFVGFIEKGIKNLKNEGVLSFIIPYPFLNQNYAEQLRKYILNNCTIEAIVDLSNIKVFEDAMVRNVIIIIKKQKDEKLRLSHNVHVITPQIPQELFGNNYQLITQKTFSEMPETMFRTGVGKQTLTLQKKILNSSILFGNIAIASWGARGVPTEDFVLDKPINEKCKKMLRGRDVDRYLARFCGKYFLYDVPKLTRPAFPELFQNEKIIISKVTGSKGLKATYDLDEHYSDSSTACCILKYHLADKDKSFLGKRKIAITENQIKLSRMYDLKYVLGMINSKLIRYYFNMFLGYGLNVYPESIEQLPIYKIDFDNSKEKNAHSSMVKLVIRMLDLNSKYAEVKDKQTSETEQLKRQIEETDRKIDEIVYKLYGLTDEEIKVVEGEKA